MIDYNEIINSSLRIMKETHADIVKFHGESDFIRINIDNGSLIIEIHNKETEEICNGSDE